MIPFPRHEGSLMLEHNPNKDSYQTVGQYLEHLGDQFQHQWKDEEAEQRAIEINELWTLDWCPDTPVGSCAVAASTLEELLELAKDDQSVSVWLAPAQTTGNVQWGVEFENPGDVE